MRRFLRASIMTLCMGLLFFFSSAQSGTLDPTFNPTDIGFGSGEGVNGVVSVTALQPDGKIVIGGNFTSYNGVARNRMVRLNADGSLDASFDPGTGANGSIYSLALQPDGKIVIGGNFTSYNGVARNRMARLNADGSLDASFNPGTGADNSITTLGVQGDGKIVIGGWFSAYNGVARSCIARLNADGSLDASFNPGTGASSVISSLGVQPDGKIVIGGNFTSYNGVARNRMARLNADGSLDASFNPGTGANVEINTVAVQPDGKIVIGGEFGTYNGVSRNHIARLNADGSLDASFNPGTGTNNGITTLVVQSDGKVVIGGWFNAYNGVYRNHMARLNADGSLDASFNPGTGTNNSVFALAVQGDGKVVIGGAFTSYNEVGKNRITRLNADGSLDASFNPGTGANNDILALTVQSDDKIVIGGWFTTYNGVALNRIARLNADGSLDASFNPGTGANKDVLAVVVQPDGKVLIGGGFTSYNGVTRNHIARLNADGSLDVSFNPEGAGADNTIYAMTLQPDGKILIAGGFTTYNGVARNHIARLNADGSLDVSFNPGTGANENIYAMTLQPDGKILIAGGFTTYNGVARNHIARLNADGTLDASFNPGTGANDDVLAVVVQPDGKILIGGGFTSYNGVTRNRIARLNADGSLDVSFNPGTGANNYLYSLAVQGDGKIVISGEFGTYNEVSRNHIARLNADGSLDASFNPGTGANSGIYKVALQSDGQVLIGGWFTSYNGGGRNRIARVNASDLTVGTITTAASCAGSTISVPYTATGTYVSGNTFTAQLSDASGSFDSPVAIGSVTATASGTITATLPATTAGGAGYRIRVVSSSPAITSLDNGSDLTVNALPATPTVTASGATAICAGSSVTLSSSATTGNQWFKDGAAISGATNATYTASTAGAYTVQVTNASSCVSLASAATTVTVNALPATPSVTTSGTTTFCAGSSVTLTSSSTTGNQWFNGSTLIPGATGQSYTAAASGSYSVKVTNASSCVSAASTATTVTVKPLPSVPTITVNGNTLTSSAASGNQWYKGSELLPGATAQTYQVQATASYQVKVTVEGCTSASALHNFVPTAIQGPGAGNGQIIVYPNPVGKTLYIKNATGHRLQLQLKNAAGVTVKESTLVGTQGALAVQELAAGAYYLTVRDQQTKQTLSINLLKIAE